MTAPKVPPASARHRARARGGRPPKHTSAQVAEALQAADGICNQAAKRLRIDRTTLRRRIAREPKLAAIRDEARELLLDDVDAAFAKMIRTPSHKGHVQAVIAYAKLQGQSRGYVASHAVDAKVEGSGAGVFVTYDATKDPEGKAAKRAALRKLQREHPGVEPGVTWMFPAKRPLPGDEPEPTAEPVDDEQAGDTEDDDA